MERNKVKKESLHVGKVTVINEKTQDTNNGFVNTMKPYSYISEIVFTIVFVTRF